MHTIFQSLITLQLQSCSQKTCQPWKFKKGGSQQESSNKDGDQASLHRATPMLIKIRKETKSLTWRMCNAISTRSMAILPKTAELKRFQ